MTELPARPLQASLPWWTARQEAPTRRERLVCMPRAAALPLPGAPRAAGSHAAGARRRAAPRRRWAGALAGAILAGSSRSLLAGRDAAPAGLRAISACSWRSLAVGWGSPGGIRRPPAAAPEACAWRALYTFPHGSRGVIFWRGRGGAPGAAGGAAGRALS